MLVHVRVNQTHSLCRAHTMFQPFATNVCVCVHVGVGVGVGGEMNVRTQVIVKLHERTTSTISKAYHEIYSDVTGYKSLYELRVIHSLSYCDGLITAKLISCQQTYTSLFTSVMAPVYT